MTDPHPCAEAHTGPFVRSPREALHGWLGCPEWQRCTACGSDVMQETVTRDLAHHAHRQREVA